ncbi:MAG: hypothetical protein ABIO86_21980 [Sphingomonas sp.]
MTDKIAELIRRFAPMSSRSAEWDFLMAGTGSRRAGMRSRTRFAS